MEVIRLISAVGAASLSYDPLGRLFQETASGAATRFLYDGGRIIGEYDGNGTLLRRYAPGAGMDETLVWYEGAGTGDRRPLFQDSRGSVIAVANAAGALTNANIYDEYGVPSANNSGRFGYTGQAWMANLSLYYYKARFYNPAIGRFMQPDPIGYAAGMNLYAYVGNDPINAVDPWGLEEDVIVVVGVRRPGLSEEELAAWFTLTTALTELWLKTGAITRINEIAMEAGAVLAAQCQTGQDKGGVTSVLGKIWNAINSIIGLAYGTVGSVVGLITGSNPKVDIGNNAIQFSNNPFAGAGAITIGNVAVYSGGPTSPIKGGGTAGPHERQHTFQGQVMGPLYIPVHAATFAYSFATTGTQDEGNPLEAGPYGNPPTPFGCGV